VGPVEPTDPGSGPAAGDQLIPPEIRAVEGEWERLADARSALPWMFPGWIAAWWRAFGVGRLHVVEARDEGELVGIIPVYRRRGVAASTANWHTPEFGPVAHSVVVPRLVAGILADRPRRLSLAFLERSRPETTQVVDACRAVGYRTIVRTVLRSPYIAIDRTWESYEAEQKGKFVHGEPRRWRRLERREQVTVVVDRGEERLPALLAEGFAVEASGWKGDRRSAIASNRATRQFYEEIANWAARRGWLRLAFLRVGSKAIAFDLAIEHGGSHYVLKTGFDPAYARFAPGSLLRQAMVKSAFVDGLSSYEFLGADQEWKLPWTSTTRDLVLLQAFAPTAAGLADWSAYSFGRPVAERVLRAIRR
jgi:CelD/BcsL family acetyltransferase involved in cellulose biosynthesis